MLYHNMCNQKNAEITELVKTHKRIIKLLKRSMFTRHYVLANSCVLHLFGYLIEKCEFFKFFVPISTAL